MNRFLFGLLVLSSASIFAQSPQKSPAPLTIETIMQDPKLWVGTSPSNPFWSDDSRTLYFNWNPDKAKGDSLYKVTLNTTTGRSSRASVLTATQPGKLVQPSVVCWQRPPCRPTTARILNAFLTGRAIYF